jgi:hypothetical protein
MPLEVLAIPPELDGCAGLNRALTGRAQVTADNDLDAIRAWLSRFVDTKTTFENYRKEAERLVLISSLTHEDCLRYQRFLADPQPAAAWVAGGGRKHARTDARWRPFYGPLSPASQRQAIVILNALFSWLVQAGYLAGNALAVPTACAARGAAHHPLSGAEHLARGQGLHRDHGKRYPAQVRSGAPRALALHPSIWAACASQKSARTRWDNSS